MAKLYSSVLVFALLNCCIINTALADADDNTIAQQPLTLSVQVPSNLSLVLSVEFPTALNRAYAANFDPNTRYTAGYFDPNKCYNYEIGKSEDLNMFVPVSVANNGKCGVQNLWSGNFLNWLNTSTIDPFRKVLTGGYRVIDTVNETVLEKSRSHYIQYTLYRSAAAKVYVEANTPLRLPTASWLYINGEAGTKMRFGINQNNVNNTAIGNTLLYQNIAVQNSISSATAFRINTRVLVCKPSLLETNCVKQKHGNYKPEGLIQKYTNKITYNVFSYLNIDNIVGGGVLRAQQKYVSPLMLGDSLKPEDNPQKEWDPNTGIFIKNPDKQMIALGIPIQDSGVINYINKFGELNTYNYKFSDPFGELYYASLRYLRNIGNVSDYVDFSVIKPNMSYSEKVRAVDNFPVYTKWNDPIKYQCQKNVTIGIGDTEIWPDGNLPGSVAFPPRRMPAEVSADKAFNVQSLLNEISSLESRSLGYNVTFPVRANGSGTNYIGALAYWAHTRDIRPDLPGQQTVDSYWVNVMAPNDASNRSNYRNIYWTASKYGGFKVPVGFDPKSTKITPDMWWTDENTRLTFYNGTQDYKPRNYFSAYQADEIQTALATVFENIVKNIGFSTGNVTSSSSYVEEGVTFYTNYSTNDSAVWSGDLKAYILDPNKQLSEIAWSLSDKIMKSDLSSRKLYTMNDTTNQVIEFRWKNLSQIQQSYFESPVNGITVPNVGDRRIEYLRGSRIDEKRNGVGLFSERDSLLADIVNSNPTFLYKKNQGFSALIASEFFNAGSSYQSFLNSIKIPLVGVGSNDGIFHVVNADKTGGSEVLGYVPKGVLPNLADFTMPEHSHRYYVDGKNTASHVYDGTSWRSIMVGSLGAGGKSVFALDLTDIAQGASVGGKKNIIWEFEDKDLGSILTPPVIAPLKINGRSQFTVIFSSGYGRQDTTKGYVWILDAITGSVIQKIEFNKTNGGELGSILAVSKTMRNIAEILYVPDTEGHIWKIDLSISNSVPTQIFTAVDSKNKPQPITAPLESTLNSNGRTVIYFGTGAFFRSSDKLNAQVQSFYAITDEGSALTKQDLLQQKITTVKADNGQEVRVLSNNFTSTEKGWYIDFDEAIHLGERVVSGARISANVILFNTITPDLDLCSGGGKTFSIAVSKQNGGRLQQGTWDINGDYGLNNSDMVLINGEYVFPSGIEITGIIGMPTEITQNNQTYLCFGKGDGSGLNCVLTGGAFPSNGYKTWREER